MEIFERLKYTNVIVSLKASFNIVKGSGKLRAYTIIMASYLINKLLLPFAKSSVCVKCFFVYFSTRTIIEIFQKVYASQFCTKMLLPQNKYSRSYEREKWVKIVTPCI